MRLVIIDNRPWAVGLSWSTMSVKTTRAEVRQRAKKENAAFDMVAVCRPQYGLGASGSVPRDWLRVRSLAGFLRLPLESFLGLFQLRDVQGSPLWWVLVRQNGLNTGGDKVFEARDAAERYLDELRDLLDLNDASIQSFPTVEESVAWLAPLLHMSLAETVLRRRGCLELLEDAEKGSSPLLGLGLLAVLAGAGWWGLTLWQEHQEVQAVREFERLTHLNAEQRKAELLAHPERYFQQPWVNMPSAEETGAVCRKTMLEQPVSVNGWLLHSATCAGRSVSVEWAHQPGADFVSLPPQAELAARNSKMAVARFALPSLRTQPREMQRYPHLLTRAMAGRQLFQTAQVVGARVRLKFGTPEKRMIDKIEITAPWAKGEWELAQLPPESLLEGGLLRVLSDLPGLTLETVIFKNNNWTFKGQLYAIH